MKNVYASSPFNGLAQQLPEIANNLAILYDMASNLQIACDSYYDPDTQYGGPPSIESLLVTSRYLLDVYANLARITGLDPCEQFDEKRNFCK